MLRACETAIPCKGLCALKVGTQVEVKGNLDPRLRGDDGDGMHTDEIHN